MALPTTTVEVCFDDTTLDVANGFTLDDAVKGKLNNPYYKLDGGLTFSDVTADVMSLSTNRGRSRELDQYVAGTATINFNNNLRKYDPLNTASAYYPYILPRRYVRIKSNGLPVFAGLVNSWSLAYEKPNQSYVTATVVDAFSIVASQNIAAFTPDEEVTGDRFNTILARPEVDLTGIATSVDTGNSICGAFPISNNEVVLNYLHKIEQTEQGFVFCSADNTLTFKSRTSVLSQSGGVAFTDDGTGTSGYTTLDVDTSDDLIFNRIVAQSPAGAVQIVSDAASISQYDTITLEATDLLNATEAEVLSIAELILQTYKQPEVRFNGLSQQLSALSLANQNLLLGLDLTNLATVKRSYTVGSPASVTKYVTVEGISHSITPSTHQITYRFGALTQAGFILNSGIFGILDVGAIS
jgi:hypothetical protein